jgi:hypothetical protein
MLRRFANCSVKPAQIILQDNEADLEIRAVIRAGRVLFAG